jgi:subtilisin-like proprotein convertase family protein
LGLALLFLLLTLFAALVPTPAYTQGLVEYGFTSGFYDFDNPPSPPIPELSLDAGQALGDQSSLGVALGDLDGDGDLDAFVANADVFRSIGQPNQVYLNQGGAQTGTPGTVDDSGQDLGDSMSWDVALGDLDGDGDLDAFVANNGANRVYLNQGGAQAGAPGEFGDSGQELGTFASSGVALGDLDGDGDLDAFVTNNGANRVYLNQGGAQVGTPGEFSDSGQVLGTFASSGVALGDLDGDGDLDAFVANGDFYGAMGHPNQVYLNLGGTQAGTPGAFGDSQDLGSSEGRSVALGDLDGDGDLDAFVAGSLNRVYVNQGGMFGDSGQDLGGDPTPPPPPASTGFFFKVALGDLDGDGDLDAFISVLGLAADTPKANRIYRNQGRGAFEDSGQALGSSDSFSVALGDLDGDGDLDAFAANIGSQANRVYLNQGGIFSHSGHELGSSNSSAVALGDLDGDGDLDAFVTNIEGQANRVFLNRQGVYSDSGQTLGSLDSLGVALGDLDGDGDLDAFVTNVGVNRVYLNQGGAQAGMPGAFSDSGQTLGIARSAAVALGDLDGDGDLDAFVANSDALGAANQVYLNQGGAQGGTPGVFGDSGQELGSSESLDVALGDLDGDGDLDALVGNSGTNRVYLNQGALQKGAPGVFRDSGQELGSSASLGVALADLDGDGDLDAFVANSGTLGTVNQVYLNQGGIQAGAPGVLSDSGQVLGSSDSRSVALGDLDGDGDLDAFVANIGAKRVLMNQGGAQAGTPGVFDEGGQTLGNYFSEDVALGDLDGDGDLDAFLANAGGQASRIYWNERQGHRDRPHNAAFLTVSRPITPAIASFYTPPQIVTSSTIPISYALFDPEGDPVGRIEGFYSYSGGDQWLPAVATSDTITSNLSSGRLIRVGRTLSPTQLITNATVTSVTLFVSDTGTIADLDLSLSISHTHNADLQATLISPAGIPITLFNGIGGSGQGFDLLFDAQAITAITSVTASVPFTGSYRPEGDLGVLADQSFHGSWRLIVTDTVPGNGGSLIAWGLHIATPAATHVYTWDTFASGLFGQSDNVVLRLVAYPQAARGTVTDTFKYYNSTPKPSQRPYVSAQTFPFRVRGTQVQVYSETVSSSTVVSNALAYRLPNGRSHGAEPMGGTENPFRTDHLGYLRGRGELAFGDQLFAMLPVSTTVHHKGALEFDGQDDYVLVDTLQGAPSTEATFSFWVLSDDSSDHSTLLSYASPATDTTFAIADPSNLTIYRGSTYSATTEIDVADGAWHHIAVTWRSADGQTVVYKDGIAILTPTLAAGTIISPGGSLLLGKNQNDEDFFQGTLDQVHIWSVIRTGQEIQDDAFRTLDGQESGLVAYWTFDQPDTATSKVCEDQTSNGSDGILYGATWDGVSMGGYTVYHTSGQPTKTGPDMFTVSQPGVQVLTVTADYPLILFDLNVSLEWDARNDVRYLEQIAFDIRRASEFLYDWTNGQAALGNITLYHDKKGWDDAHVRVYASNHLRPNAAQGGMVLDILTETVPITPSQVITYAPGQVRMGAVWSRYGESGDNLGEDWPRTLAHELGHYLFFLDDNYLGFDPNTNLLVPIHSCPGAMADPYRDDYGEFHPNADWTPDCEQTLSHQLAGRSDWATIQHFYSWLHTPTTTIDGEGILGPNALPLAVTQIRQDPQQSGEPSTAFEVPIFVLVGDAGRYVAGDNARAFLFHDQRLTDLGGPTRDQVHARGARPGDTLCVFDPSASYQGCRTVNVSGDAVHMRALPHWLPEIELSSMTTDTLQITVRVTATASLKARLFRIGDVASQVLTLTQQPDPRSHVGTLTFISETLPMEGFIHIWEDTNSSGEPDEDEAQAITDFSLGGNPGFIWSRGGFIWSRGGFIWSRGGFIWSRGGFIWSRGGFIWSRGGFIWSRGAPGMSADGQAMIFGRPEDLSFAENELFALQSATYLPQTPPWTTAVGQGYRLVLSEDAAVDLSEASISITYMGSQVPPGEEEWLRLYYWDEATEEWRQLPTELDTYHNTASAAVQGPGLYALMSSIEIPLYEPGWNLVAYPVQGSRTVTEALASIQGAYSFVYGHIVTDTVTPWRVHAVGVPGYVNDLHQLTFGHGYWISATQAVTWFIKGHSGYDMSSASAFGYPPATYYGTVEPGAGFVPSAGVPVYAYVNGHLCGQGTTLEAGGQVVYSIKVLADGPGGAAGCGEQGQRVTFYVGSHWMSPTAVWDDSRLWELALRPGDIYLPLVLKNH